MSRKFWLCKRGKVYYSLNSETGKRESLQTDDKEEAARIIHAKNDATRQSGVNITIAKAYLVGADPKLVERKWSWVMDEYCSRGKETTRQRNQRATRGKPFNLIRDKKLIETTADDLRAVMKAGGAFTNHFLRCLHNLAIGMGWVLHPIIPPKLWPKSEKRPKRGITLEEHHKIIQHENNAERRLYYEILWEIGAAQTDGANLTAANIDWDKRLLSYHRQKTGEASDALLAIERHSGVKPVELHKIRRQDPSLGRDFDERKQIKQYRQAVESAAAGKVAESFAGLDKMGAVVACGLGDQADKLADEYLRLAEQNSSAVVVSQTWAEVHRVNSRVRDALKAKGLLGTNDVIVEVLDKLDLTNAQKRDERFYPKDAVVVFNQKIREAEPGTKGKPAGIVKSGLLVDVGGQFVTVSNKMLDRVSVCLPRECQVSTGDRLHLKANRKLVSGGRVTNGELVTVKSVRPDGGVELTDGRVLDKSFREFLPGYAVTSYGSQGKTVDYVLFSDSTVKAATNAQQWYVTISRGRRGIRIFTPDKEQLRENVARSGHRPLAMELMAGFVPRRGVRLWDRLHGHLLRFGQRAADTFCRLKLARRRHPQPTQKHEHKNTRMLVE